MKNLKKNVLKRDNGITLIALVVTIIVLLILAGISISMLSGNNGVLQRATEAKTQNEVEQEKETISLAYDTALINKVSRGDTSLVDARDLNVVFQNEETKATARDESNSIEITFDSGNSYTIDSFGNIEKKDPPKPMIEGKTIKESKGNIVAESNTNLVDDYGNKITIPKGFKIVEGTNVTDGVVIEDVNAETKNTVGSQFVWIPVGTIKKNETQTIQITLGRYSSTDTGNPLLKQNASNYESNVLIQWNGDNFYEYDSTNTTYTNAKAKSLSSFIQSATSNKGYYIGRYESGINENIEIIAKDGSVKPVIKSGAEIWNNVTQSEASTISRNMYSTLNSDLVNSYAWDTAIMFIQKCGNKANSATYSSTIGKSINNNLARTGMNILRETNQIDEQCNVFDMAGNAYEYSTETNTSATHPCVIRGGDYITSGDYTSQRYCDRGAMSDGTGFRVILYI